MWLRHWIAVFAWASIATAGFARATGPESTPPYATAHTAALDPVAKEIAKLATYTQFRVEFNGIMGGRVPGFLYVPVDGKMKHPAVLLQYGSGGNKGTNYIVALGRQFVGHGFVVLTIDIPSKGERKKKEKDPLPFQGHFLETLGDYSRSVDYLTSRPDVDVEKLSYTGISWGAITGITFVAHDSRIKVMASMVGGGNFLGLIPGASDAETRKAVEKWDPVFHVGLIAPRPLLLLNVTKDQLVPRVMADSLHKAAGEGAKKVWLETDHFFTGLDRAEVGETVVKFVQENLDGQQNRRAEQ